MKFAVIKRCLAMCCIAALMSHLAGAKDLHALNLSSKGSGLSGGVSDASDTDMYAGYLERHAHAARPDNIVEIPLTDYKTEEAETGLRENYLGKKGTSVYTDDTGCIEWSIQVETAGLYALQVDYVAEYRRGASIERRIEINGKPPYKEAESIVFSRLYQDDPNGKGKTDFLGNDIRPSQVEVKQWQTTYIKDYQGYYEAPLLFYLPAGRNTVRLVSVSEPMTIGGIRLQNMPEQSSYADKLKEYADKGYQDAAAEPITIQGENAALKSSPVLYPMTDKTTPSTEPPSINTQKLNTIGGSRWASPKQFVEWNFHVEKAGLYTVYLKARQNVTRGVTSNRAIYIDGKVPFKEWNNYEIDFDSKWQMLHLGQDGVPYRIYLDAGDHVLKMEVTLGKMAEHINRVQSILQEMNAIYTTVMIVTGSKPDTMRDYMLDELIPEEITRMGALADELQEEVDWFSEYTGGKGQNVSTLNTVIRQLRKMHDKPRDIPKNLEYYKTNIGNLGTWLVDVRSQPLEIDYMVIASSDSLELPKTNAGFFEQFGYSLNQFIRSFFDDYASIGSAVDNENQSDSITVWLSTGRDQAQVLRKLIDSGFAAQHDFGVKLELVTPATLLPATVAGIGPDVALNMGDAEPVNYAIRNAVIDLNRFPDFEKIAGRFMKERLVSMSFDEKTYALPETQTFNVLFYRKDILADLGLSVPQTWNEVVSALSILQKNNMSFAMPVSTAELPQAGVTSYYTRLFQEGGRLYKNGGISSDLDSDIGLLAFKEWTNLYINYELPKEYNFQNRFRTGEYPLIVADFSQFNTLTVSAPEIRGLWSFTLVPGTEKEDGSIDRSVPFGGTNCFILKNSNHYSASWEFLKWWTSADAQMAFGTEMESVLGESARYATANMEAFERIPWTNEMYKVLSEQMTWGRGIEQVPGAYFTGRHLDNAFRRVTILSKDPKDTLYDYVYTINQELIGKRKEFGLSTE